MTDVIRQIIAASSVKCGDAVVGGTIQGNYYRVRPNFYNNPVVSGVNGVTVNPTLDIRFDDINYY